MAWRKQLMRASLEERRELLALAEEARREAVERRAEAARAANFGTLVPRAAFSCSH